jgi:hypothetical protein
MPTEPAASCPGIDRDRHHVSHSSETPSFFATELRKNEIRGTFARDPVDASLPVDLEAQAFGARVAA